jgi:Eukaryotic aspartyl protease
MAPTVIRIPINNVKGGGDYTGEIRVGSQGTVANVILDTGSSTLAVVPRLYKIADDKNVSYTAFAQLVTYGTGGWSGPVLETTLSMGSGDNQASVKTYIAIADEQLPHDLGKADGILGLAFNALNSAYDLTAYLTSQHVDPPFTYPWLFPVKTSKAALQQVEQFLARMTEIDLTPYFTALEDSDVSRNIFAFYTLRSTPNNVQPDPENDPLNNGIFVLGGGLDQTDLYTGQPLNVAVLDDLYYNTNLKAVQVGDANPVPVAQLPPAQAKTLISNSIVDSGTNSLVLAQDVYQAVITALGSSGPGFATLISDATSQGAVPQSSLDLSGWPNLGLVMQGADGTDVTLTCAPTTYWQTNATQGSAVFQINNGGNFPLSILGLPLFNNYYTVFDRTQNPYGTINFAPIATPTNP